MHYPAQRSLTTLLTSTALWLPHTCDGEDAVRWVEGTSLMPCTCMHAIVHSLARATQHRNTPAGAPLPHWETLAAANFSAACLRAHVPYILDLNNCSCWTCTCLSFLKRTSVCVLVTECCWKHRMPYKYVVTEHCRLVSPFRMHNAPRTGTSVSLGGQ